MQRRACAAALRENHRSRLHPWKQVHTAEYHSSVGLLIATTYSATDRDSRPLERSSGGGKAKRPKRRHSPGDSLSAEGSVMEKCLYRAPGLCSTRWALTLLVTEHLWNDINSWVGPFSFQLNTAFGNLIIILM